MRRWGMSGTTVTPGTTATLGIMVIRGSTATPGPTGINGTTVMAMATGTTMVGIATKVNTVVGIATKVNIVVGIIAESRSFCVTRSDGDAKALL